MRRRWCLCRRGCRDFGIRYQHVVDWLQGIMSTYHAVILTGWVWANSLIGYVGECLELEMLGVDGRKKPLDFILIKLLLLADLLLKPRWEELQDERKKRMKNHFTPEKKNQWRHSNPLTSIVQYCLHRAWNKNCSVHYLCKKRGIGIQLGAECKDGRWLVRWCLIFDDFIVFLKMDSLGLRYSLERSYTLRCCLFGSRSRKFECQTCMLFVSLHEITRREFWKEKEQLWLAW